MAVLSVARFMAGCVAVVGVMAIAPWSLISPYFGGYLRCQRPMSAPVVTRPQESRLFEPLWVRLQSHSPGPHQKGGCSKVNSWLGGAVGLHIVLEEGSLRWVIGSAVAIKFF